MLKKLISFSLILCVVLSAFTVISFAAADTYTVTFDTNGVKISMELPTRTAKIGEKVLMPSPMPYGYELLGWSTDKNATTAEYKGCEMYAFTEDTVLYAVWKKTVEDTPTVPDTDSNNTPNPDSGNNSDTDTEIDFMAIIMKIVDFFVSIAKSMINLISSIA